MGVEYVRGSSRCGIRCRTWDLGLVGCGMWRVEFRLGVLGGFSEGFGGWGSVGGVLGTPYLKPRGTLLPHPLSRGEKERGRRVEASPGRLDVLSGLGRRFLPLSFFFSFSFPSFFPLSLLSFLFFPFPSSSSSHPRVGAVYYRPWSIQVSGAPQGRPLVVGSRARDAVSYRGRSRVGPG